MGKKILGFASISSICGIIWYLFIWQGDYRVTFTVKTFPGAINQHIKLWATTLEQSRIIEQKDLSNLTQQLILGDSTHIYNWQITSLHDSLSQVRVYSKDPDHSIINRLRIPFSDTNFEKRTRKTLIDFNTKLREHINSFKIEIVGEEATNTTFCACTEGKSTLYGKADGMMKDFPLLSSFLVNNDIQLSGTPFLEVTQWNKEDDTIVFNFCFPIIQADILPQHPDLKYRNFYGKKAIKAIYNGNYITSDRAWFALLDYAEKNKINVNALPIEYFHNNPNMGGDGLTWKAEIFLPLKE